MTDIPLRGIVIGFEEYGAYALKNPFGPSSPYRVLACLEAPVAFLVVSPFSIVDDYSLEIEDGVAHNLDLAGEDMQNVAVMCIARNDNGKCFVNLRSPLIINTGEGRFQQVILQNESYGVSVSFSLPGCGT